MAGIDAFLPGPGFSPLKIGFRDFSRIMPYHAWLVYFKIGHARIRARYCRGCYQQRQLSSYEANCTWGEVLMDSGKEDNDISQDEEESIREEMQNDLKEKRSGIATDSLIYWKSNCEKYLAKLVRRYHSAPAGSAASERIFSSGGNVLGLRRLSLKP